MLDWRVNQRLSARIQLVTVAVLGLSVVVASEGATITVCWDGSGDHLTIQAGIAAANAGDEVVVCDGTYTGLGNKNLDFLGKDITVQSANGRDYCIIDCQNDGRAFYIWRGESSAAVIDGFTIRNGYVEYDSGGGIACDGSSPTVKNCTISNNTAVAFGSLNPALGGGGVYCEGGSPTLSNCIINDNQVNGANASGGGILCYQSSITISNCEITWNTAADAPSYGGGISTENSSANISGCIIADNSVQTEGGGLELFTTVSGTSVNIEDCTISDNTAQTGGGVHYASGSNNGDLLIADSVIEYNDGHQGGGIAVTSGTGNHALDNCTISENSATANGGGMCCSYAGPAVKNCTFADNFASFDGGGIAVYDNANNAFITNCLIAGNTSEAAVSGRGGGGIFCVPDANGFATISNCVIVQNSAVSGGGGVHTGDSGGSRVAITDCTITGNVASHGRGVDGEDEDLVIVNSIIWGNGAQGDSQIVHEEANEGPIVNYCLVQGGWTGQGGVQILDEDPLFLDADGADDDPDTWDDNDYRLSPPSPCIDAAENSSVPADTLDLDGDGNTAEPLPYDAHCRTRFVDYALKADTGSGTPPIVDMGALEFQACPGDWNGDDIIYLQDLAAVLAAYDTYVGDPAYDYYVDFDQDGHVYLSDLAVVLGNYGASCDNQCN